MYIFCITVLNFFIILYPIVYYHIFLANPPHLILSYPSIISNHIPSSPILSYTPVQPIMSHPTLYHPDLWSYPTPSHQIPSHPVLSRAILLHTCKVFTPYPVVSYSLYSHISS